jgi:hypothetical protein
MSTRLRNPPQRNTSFNTEDTEARRTQRNSRAIGDSLNGPALLRALCVSVLSVLKESFLLFASIAFYRRPASADFRLTEAA